MTFEPAATITTARLTMRPLRSSDAGEMVAVLSDPSLYEFTGGDPPDLEQLERDYRRLVAGPGRGTESWFNWIVRRTCDRRSMGFVQATVVDRNADVAWLVAPEHQGQGYATEAARGMCGWLNDHGVDRFRAHIHPLHVASQRVAVALGMRASGDSDDDGEEIWVD